MFLMLMLLMVRFHDHERRIQGVFQAIDSKCCPAPLGGEATSKSPVDRRKLGSKIHLLVNAHSAPLSVCVRVTTIHDKWLVDDLIISIVIPRPDPDAVKQHLCVDKGYDYADIHQLIEVAHYAVHIKLRRRRAEPQLEECPVPGKTQFPSHRWVVECTLSGLAKRRSLRVPWCKKANNWLGFIQLACSHILMDLAVSE